jgi:hypothetical protein
MTQVQVERDIYIRATRAHELLSQARQTFQDYLDDVIPPNDPKYYRARNFLKEGKAFYDQLLGPIPIYASKDFEGWRAQILEENKIVVHGQTLEDLRSELLNDDFIKTIMPPEEIGAYLDARFEAQKTGKRKLSNIKIRMTIDCLAALLQRGQELQRAAQRKQQGLPV